MTHPRKTSLRFKVPKPPHGAADDVTRPQCSSPDGETPKTSDDSTLSRLLTEGDLKRRKLTSKLGRLEELNKVIEERIKSLIYQPERGQESRGSDSPIGRWREESWSPPKGVRRRKEVGGTGKKAKEGEDVGRKKGETLAEFIQAEREGSEFSLEKILGICRTKVRTMDDHREEMLDAIPVTEHDREVRSPDPSVGSGVNRSSSDVKEGKTSKSPGRHGGKSHGHHHAKPQQQQDAESSKARINEILKGHAQKVSSDSIKSGRESITPLQEVQKVVKTVKNAGQNVHKNQKKAESPKADGSPTPTKAIRKGSPAEPEKKYQKVIEIEKRVDRKKQEGEESDKKPQERVAEVKAKEKADGEVKTAEEDSPATECGEEEPPKGQEGGNKDGGELEKRVTYTNQSVAKESAKSEGTPKGVVVASVLEKLNSPFKEPVKEAPEMGRSRSAGVESKRTAAGEADAVKPAAARTPSETLLLTSMIDSISKPRVVRPPPSVKDQANKPVEHTIKTKSSRSTELKDLVAQAIKDHKIFCIFDNHWYIVRPVREELLNRGWMEVIPERRMIPRRKPPPAGPTVDRLAMADYAMEALLTAKEAFADDITDEMRYPPTKPSADRPRTQRKFSEDSLKETYSEFRIVPPTTEKKKNNAEIREFVTKYRAAVSEADKRKPAVGSQQQNGSAAAQKAPVDSAYPSLAPTSPSLLAILTSISENKKMLAQMAENKDEEDKAKDGVDVLYKTGQGKVKDEQTRFSRNLLTESESKIASKIIQTSNSRIHFMWLSIKPAIHLKCFNYSPEIVNKFQKTTFCTKIGLWSHLNNIHWYAHEVTFSAKSPRMYNTGEADDLNAFFQDFQMTACMSMLKWLSETFFDKGIKGVQKKKGKVPIKAFEFAIRQCERYIRFHENEDLNALEEPKVLQDEWNTFLQWFYVITNDHGKLQETSNAQLMVVYTKAVEVLRAMKRHWPEFDVDGRLNIWIMKPYCASCGRGIFMTNNVYYIGQHSKYIVQKYIERPLLIYNTKFDIRQWFMITKLIPLEIWMYKECYLRFCTQPFALRNLHESVHLSNNSVQRKYVSQRDPSLPDQNMWDSNTFQQYLKTIGQPNAWNEIIYPGMRDAIISIMLAAQDTFDTQRKSWFEVYGADFMISANLKDGPWLIEINENPAMDPSTKVTARLCPQMLRDVIKVIVDKRTNKNALTGQWELVYRQNYSPSFGTIDIDVKGKRIARYTQSVKVGHTANATTPPLFQAAAYTPGKKENSAEKDQNGKKQYEVVKTYNPKRGKGGSQDSDRQVKSKQSATRVRGKAKLLTESEKSAERTVKSQKGGRKSG